MQPAAKSRCRDKPYKHTDQVICIVYVAKTENMSIKGLSG